MAIQALEHPAVDDAGRLRCVLCDDDQLYRADTELLSDVLQDFINSGQPGVAALFVYAVRPETCGRVGLIG